MSDPPAWRAGRRLLTSRDPASSRQGPVAPRLHT